jgi:hypothetical protein
MVKAYSTHGAGVHAKEGKRTLGRTRCRWKGNITGIESKLRTGFAWLRIERPVVGCCGHGNEPSGDVILRAGGV